MITSYDWVIRIQLTSKLRIILCGSCSLIRLTMCDGGIKLGLGFNETKKS